MTKCVNLSVKKPLPVIVLQYHDIHIIIKNIYLLLKFCPILVKTIIQ